MLMLRRTVGVILVGIPILIGSALFVFAFVELPPVRLVTLAVITAGSMIAAGNYLLDK